MTPSLNALMPDLSRILESHGLDRRSLALRRLVIDGLAGGQRGHLGSALSLIEIVRVLYDDILRVDPRAPQWSERDRFILSKGHGCLALYAILADKGFFPADELSRFCRFDGRLGGHPDAAKVPGVEASTGALGHGLSIGVGMALAARLKRSNSRVFVVMGDGEIDEGSVWEAAMCASKHRLASLTAIIDYNRQQSYAATAEVLDLEPLADKWRAFGFAVYEADGHDVAYLRDVFTRLPQEPDRPTAVICHTVKGKGIYFAENNPDWHHKSKISSDDLTRLRAELGG